MSKAERRFWRTQRGKLARDFLGYKATEGGLATSTLRAYTRGLFEFLSSLGRGRGALHTRKCDVDKYLAMLWARHLNARTVAHQVSLLRGFFNYLQREGLMHRDPMVRIVSPRQWKTLPKVLVAKRRGPRRTDADPRWSIHI